jgi:hypothetical protein
MSTSFHCDDKDTLVAYLYDEVDADLRRQVTAHLRSCVACAEEVDTLRSVQRSLTEWQPPAIDLNFAIVQKPATVLRPARWAAPSIPAWGRAVAAMLLVAAGAAIANVQVRYSSDGFTVTTGWLHAPPAASARVDQRPAEDWRPALAALESDFRRELQTLRSATTEPQMVSQRSSDAPTNDSDAVIRRVQALLSESERRQQQELATRMAQFGREVTGDLFRMDQGFRELQGQTRVVQGTQRQMVDFLRRVSTQTQQVP